MLIPYKKSRRAFLKLGASVVASSMAFPALARQSYPYKPVRIIVGLPPGGAADTVVRTLAPPLAKIMGQPVIVDNRPGGQLAISVQSLINAPDDGHTILFISNGYPCVQATQQLFDLQKDTLPIIQLGTTPIVIMVRADSPYKSLSDLVNDARANPGKVTYSTMGPASIEHLKMAQIERVAGFTGNAIPYRGGPDSMQALLAGHIDFSLSAAIFAKTFVPAGKARVLAVLENERWQDLPDVPTMKEAGVDVPALDYWGGYVAKAGTPPEIASILFNAIAEAMKSQSVIDQLVATANSPKVSQSQGDFAQAIARDLQWMTEEVRLSKGQV